MFSGVLPALVTPFKEGKIDFASLEKIINLSLQKGASGFVILGTTAETPALSFEEKEEIIKFCCSVVNKRAKIIVGAGSNNTEQTLKNIRLAAKYLPDAVLVVTPYYNKPNLSGMIAHYKLCAKEGLPIILYHIPGRTGQKLSLSFFESLLGEVPQIIGVKESDYDITHVVNMAVGFGKNRLNYICGNDDLWPVFLGLGSRTLITAAGNVLLPAYRKVYDLFCAGKTQEALDIFRAAYALTQGCFFEVNPTCCKYVLEKLGLCSAEVRLPLGPISAQTKEKLDKILQSADRGLLL